MKTIIKTSEGDLRKAITTLQSAHRLKGEEGIEANDIYEIAGVSLLLWSRLWEGADSRGKGHAYKGYHNSAECSQTEGRRGHRSE